MDLIKEGESIETYTNLKGAIMKEIINNCICVFGIMTIVVVAWRCLEIVMLGHINPNDVDTVVGFVLTLSLYGNFKNWIKKK